MVTRPHLLAGSISTTSAVGSAAPTPHKLGGADCGRSEGKVRVVGIQRRGPHGNSSKDDTNYDWALGAELVQVKCDRDNLNLRPLDIVRGL